MGMGRMASSTVHTPPFSAPLHEMSIDVFLDPSGPLMNEGRLAGHPYLEAPQLALWHWNSVVRLPDVPSGLLPKAHSVAVHSTVGWVVFSPPKRIVHSLSFRSQRPQKLGTPTKGKTGDLESSRHE